MENIYHCCIQKSGSQWIRDILADSRVRRRSGMVVHVPGKDFILARRNRRELTAGFPPRTIVSPLYVPRDAFDTIPSGSDWRAFWVMRDPRDMVVSRYFSHRFSHALLNPQLARQREFLRRVSMEEGLARMIRDLGGRSADLLRALESWIGADRDPRIRLVRYEDLVGRDAETAFQALFVHCGLHLSRRSVQGLLKRYSFRRLSGGRRRGDTDPSNHYRQGLAGDWRNHFTSRHRRLFRQVSQDLLQQLGYEATADW